MSERTEASNDCTKGEVRRPAAPAPAGTSAVKTLLGEKEYAKRFGKSQLHRCGSHAKCGSSAHILNWVPTAGTECKDQGGLLIEEVNGRKVAKKA